MIARRMSPRTDIPAIAFSSTETTKNKNTLIRKRRVTDPSRQHLRVLTLNMLARLPSDVLTHIGYFEILEWDEFYVSRLDKWVVGKTVENTFVIGALHALRNLRRLRQENEWNCRYDKVWTASDVEIGYVLKHYCWHDLDNGKREDYDTNLFSMFEQPYLHTARGPVGHASQCYSPSEKISTIKVALHTNMYLSKSVVIPVTRFGWRIPSSLSRIVFC